MANSSTNVQPIFTTDQVSSTNVMAFANSLTPSEIPYTNILDHATILDVISSTTTMGLPSSWSWQSNRLSFEGQLYVPDHQDLCLQIICNHHDHPMAGHFRQTKTIKLISQNFHWPGLGCMVNTYISSCTTYPSPNAPSHTPNRQ